MESVWRNLDIVLLPVTLSMKRTVFLQWKAVPANHGAQCRHSTLLFLKDLKNPALLIMISTGTGSSTQLDCFSNLHLLPHYRSWLFFS